MIYKEKKKENFFNKRPEVWISIFLIVATLSVYWQVRNHEFINYDDDKFITDNRLTQSGLTLESIKSAFKKNLGYWKPVTLLSLMLDYEIYGMDSGGFHMTNLLFHIANTLILFIFLRRATGALWQSGFVAALFALHPLHVESVAWVSERKDVLSTFFWMLTMLAYFHYIKKPGIDRYLLILIPLALGLMAKPMLVTLPFVLLLFDYWPLGRLQLPEKRLKPKPLMDEVWKRSPGGKQPALVSKNSNSSHVLIRSVSRLIWEKIPMLILVAGLILTVILLRVGEEAVRPDEFSSFVYRMSNALVSYLKYIEKMVWPQNLAVPYPYMAISWQQTAFTFLILFSISFAAVKVLRSRPYIAVGWFFYLGTIVPVIALTKFGLFFAMADRFTYIPLIGLFIIIAWGIPELMAEWRYRKVWLTTLATVVLTILMAMTWEQVGYWENSITLFEHTLKITSNNVVAHNNLGNALNEQGRTAEAIKHYLQALRIKPDYEDAHNNLGNALNKQNRTAEAIEHYLHALRIRPDYAKAHSNLGTALYKQGRTAEAIEHYLQALQIRPDYVEAHNNIGVALDKQDRTAEAIEHYLQALQIKPDYVDAHYNLGIALSKQGFTAEAIEHFLQALRIRPDYVEAHNNLGIALVKQGRTAEAIEHYFQALRIRPDYVDAHSNLGAALDKQGRTAEAIEHYLQALRIRPDYVEAHYNLGVVLNKQGHIEEAIEYYLQALRIKPDFEEAYNNLGIALFRKGNIEGAIAHFRKALNINPDFIPAKNNLKKILMMQQQNK
ncbi:tetratricopeptide repeat protein [Thermodesulfobacteriota bacterium]